MLTLASCARRRPISRRGLIKTGRHQREISGETVTTAAPAQRLRPYLSVLFPKCALLRRQPREASVRLKVADQGISALQSDLANGLNIIGHDGKNGQTYNRPTDAPVTAARDSEAVRLSVLGELKASGAPVEPWEPLPGMEKRQCPWCRGTVGAS